MSNCLKRDAAWSFCPKESSRAVFFVRTGLLETSFRPGMSSGIVFLSEQVSWRRLFVRARLLQTSSRPSGSFEDVFLSELWSCLLVRTCAPCHTRRHDLATEDVFWGGTITWNHDFTFGAVLHLRQRLSPLFVQSALYSPRALKLKSYLVLQDRSRILMLQGPFQSVPSRKRLPRCPRKRWNGQFRLGNGIGRLVRGW